MKNYLSKQTLYENNFNPQFRSWIIYEFQNILTLKAANLYCIRDDTFKFKNFDHQNCLWWINQSWSRDDSLSKFCVFEEGCQNTKIAVAKMHQWFHRFIWYLRNTIKLDHQKRQKLNADWLCVTNNDVNQIYFKFITFNTKPLDQ